MQGTIQLAHPIMVDGEQQGELDYDCDAITPAAFIEADAKAANIAQARNASHASVAEFDTGFHFYLGVMAVVAANPGWEPVDVERVRGTDIVRLMEVGRAFMTAGAAAGEGAASGEEEDGAEAWLDEPDSFHVDPA